MDMDREVGEALEWTPAQRPGRVTLRGTHVVLRPVDAAADPEPLHAVSLEPDNWTYLPDGPYESPADMRRMLEWAATSDDPLYFTLARPPDGSPAGIASYLRITPEHGSIEVGHIWFGTS